MIPREPGAIASLLTILVASLTSGILDADDARFFLPKHHLSRQFGGECWGHEADCSADRGFSRPICRRESQHYTGRRLEDVFYEQADFGYLRKILDSLDFFCEAEEPEDSSLSCSKDLLFCKGRNLYLDLRDVQDERRSLKYQMDILKSGQIGGRCHRFHEERLKNNLEFMSALQSWAPEMRFFKSFDQSVGEMCDVVVEKTTFVMKLDATVNMYHHFCDFFNLYASLHLLSHFDRNAFDRDVNVMIWENQEYESNFRDVFRAFTVNPLLNLNSFGRNRVCFRNLIFPLPPRMVFGLFYNTPLVDDCERSGLFKAFSEFLTFRLNVPSVTSTDSNRLKVTIISRQTMHRKILNENELVSALESTGLYDVTLAKFTHGTNFLQQLSVIHNSDILIGMHGAGLTHSLFLRDWAVLFELYHCEDPGCYHDLARLRGIRYLTWTNETLLTTQEVEGRSKDDPNYNAKFTNYAFDKNEFLRKVEQAAKFVRTHPEFIALDIQKKDEL